MGGSGSKIKTGSAHRDRVILFGDSLTQQSFAPQGWGAALADAYQRRADVLNRGYSGYTTRWCLEMLRHGGGIMADAGPEDTTKLVTILLGANDASLEDQNPAQHVPLDEYKSNLREIVVICRERAPHAKILMICPPPVCHSQRLQFQKERFGEQASGKLERTNENAGLYADAAEHLASEMGLPVLNLWKVLQEESNWPELLSDGLHFSPKGNALVGQKILQKIADVFPELAVVPCKYTGSYGNSGSSCSGITTDSPWWENIDTACPANSFAALDGR